MVRARESFERDIADAGPDELQPVAVHGGPISGFLVATRPIHESRMVDERRAIAFRKDLGES